MEQRTRSICLALAAWTAFVGCASHQPEPIDPAMVLAGLEAVDWQLDDEAAVPSEGDGPVVGPRELASFAVTTNPRLAAVRAQIGLRRAMLVEAGLLPDPQVGWDAMDVLAVELTGGTPTTTEYLAGLGLWFPLLRPGERDARVGAAEWRAEEAVRAVAAAEWTLTRQVHVAFEEARASAVLRAQVQALAEVAETSYEYFRQAQEAGAATAIDSNLALLELQAIRLESVRVQGREARARQALNALLGLPPTYELRLGESEDPSANPVLGLEPEELVDHAVAHRPDLAQLLARYEAAEEGVRLAVSTQYPRVAIGTGIAFSIPVFSKFGRPAIAVALARREIVKRTFTAAVHSARQEVHSILVSLEQARREVDLIGSELLPTAEENLELSRASLTEGEITLFQTLALQRALVTARTRHTEARLELSRSAWSLLAASGHLLSPTPPSE